MFDIASFKPKHLLLNLLSAAMIIIFVMLGYWQLSRAQEKKLLLQSFSARTMSPFLHSNDLLSRQDLRFYQTRLHGQFENDHTFLLDNKIQNGKVGYEVYTPFKADEFSAPILVDRGFIPLGISRSILPDIKSIPHKLTISGMLDLPPRYFALGNMLDGKPDQWPLRIEYLNLSKAAKQLHTTFYPYVLRLATHHPAAYEMKWQILTMTPERHTAYAFQWFAFALTLLIISVTLNYRSK